MRIIISFMIIVIFCIININGYPQITAQDIDNLRVDIRWAIDNSTTGECGLIICDEQPLIGSMVRLVFHDCTGRNIKQNKGNGRDSPSRKLQDNICNGCFDFDDPQSAGLNENAYQMLEDVYQGVTSFLDIEWDTKMSRADFWVAAATVGLEYAAENQFRNEESPIGCFIVPAPLPDIPYYFGRKDCPRSPEATEKGVFQFPDTFAAWNETKQWFVDNFWDDINITEIVALMGGHTLGRAHADASGYVSRWTTNISVLNSEYYFNLLTEPLPFMGQGDWTQTSVSDIYLCENSTDFFNITCNGRDLENRTLNQWVIGPDTSCCPIVSGIILQLNTDMSLALDIEPHLNRTTGEVSCTAPTPEQFDAAFDAVFTGQSVPDPAPDACKFQNETKDIVNFYAVNNAAFLNDFAIVWEKMTLLGLTKLRKLQKLIVPYDRSIEFVQEPCFPVGNGSFGNFSSGTPPPGVGGGSGTPPPAFGGGSGTPPPGFAARSQNKQNDYGQHSVVSEDNESSKYDNRWYYYASFIAVVFILICVVSVVYRYYKRSRSESVSKQCENKADTDTNNTDNTITELEVTSPDGTQTIDVTTTSD